jgi:3-deoxy-manno-octulosonate cytidylyltransferase (CMP-KDO synthetase)
MIEHVYRRAAEARGVDGVVVATDDARIADAVQRFGGVVRLTDGSHRTGTDRIAEVARTLDCAIVVNVQGDLPLLDPEMIARAVEPLRADPSLRMATICTRIVDADEYTRPSVVKVVCDRAGDALYFSRAPIPHTEESGFSRTPIYKHIGLYAYRRDFLLEFAALPPTTLEQVESLEQLRALEHRVRIRVVEVPHASIEVDTPDDLERVRRMVAGAREECPGIPVTG